MKAAASVTVAMASTATAAMTASPIAKVIEMIGDLQSKIIAEGDASQKVYEEFSEWCEERAKELMFEVKTGKAGVGDLKAVIDEEAATIESLTAKVEGLSASIASDDKDLKAATEVRGKEASDAQDEEKESEQVIDTLKRAIGVLEKQGASMLQLKGATNVASALSVMVQASALNAADAQRLTALVQTTDEEDEAGAPAAASYESHSSGIIETLQGLLDKAESQLEAARSKEQESLHNYELLKQNLNDQLRTAKKGLEKAQKGIAAASEKKAVAEGDLEVTSKDLQGDTSTLAAVHHDCMTRANEFEAETNSRGEELKALADAKKVINEATSLTQVSFLQTASTSDVSAENFQVVRLVRRLAQTQHSKSLALLASKIASAVRAGARSGNDPFAKIKGLIRDMIAKLETEGEEAASHKAYCDKEMGETKVKFDDKTAEIDKLKTSLDDMTAQAAKLRQDVGVLQQELANIASSQSEMDRLRREESGNFKAAFAENKKGLDGIRLALTTLRDYYGKADKAHGAADGAGNGIIDLLEVVESDFEKTLADLDGEEKIAQRDYEQESKQNQMDTTVKSSDVKYKSQEATDLEKASAETSEDLRTVQAELDAVSKYNAQLADECIEKATPYEEKAKRREAEIAGLREALEVLSGDAALLQESSARQQLRGVHVHGSRA